MRMPGRAFGHGASRIGDGPSHHGTTVMTLPASSGNPPQKSINERRSRRSDSHFKVRGFGQGLFRYGHDSFDERLVFLYGFVGQCRVHISTRRPPCRWGGRRRTCLPVALRSAAFSALPDGRQRHDLDVRPGRTEAFHVFDGVGSFSMPIRGDFQRPGLLCPRRSPRLFPA